MKRRIYSDTFVDRQIAKIDDMYERNMQNLIMTPRCLMPDGNLFYSPKITESDREEIKVYYKQFQDLSYVRGFWMGYSIRDGIKDTE